MIAPERLKRLLAEFPPSDPGTVGDGNIVLVERSRFDGSYYLTTHATVEECAHYRVAQEHAEDWLFELCVALDSGLLYDECVSVKYELAVYPATHYPEEVTA
jgi:hypothetical protein